MSKKHHHRVKQVLEHFTANHAMVFETPLPCGRKQLTVHAPTTVYTLDNV